MHDVVIFVVGNLGLVALGIICMVIAMFAPEEETHLDLGHEGGKPGLEELNDELKAVRQDSSGDARKCVFLHPVPTSLMTEESMHSSRNTY